MLWDNRITAHSAIADFDQIGGRRNGARITPQAERPIPANGDLVVPDGPVEDMRGHIGASCRIRGLL